MATSGTNTFNLDITEIMEEAFDLCGLDLRSVEITIQQRELWI